MVARPGCVAPRTLLLACAIAALAAACGSDPGAEAGSASTASPAAPSTGAEVTVADPWVRATKGIPDPSMTTVFGMFSNHTDKDLTIVSAVNTLTDHTELHQMTMNGDAMVMGPAVGGIKIPANSTTSLDPNSLHIMIMDLNSVIQPGDEVTITATLNDGYKVTFAAMGKEYAGGNESYPTGSSPSTATPGTTGMGGMTMTPTPSGPASANNSG